MREAIPPDMRLAITLHHLAEGASFSALKYHWRSGKSTVAGIVYETCAAIWRELMLQYLAPPCTPRDWQAIGSR